MTGKFLLLLSLLALAGCAQIGMFTAQDAVTAAAVNPSNATCYQAFGALGQAQAGTTGGGILTAVATKAQLKEIMASSACLSLTAAVLAELVKIGIPGGVLIAP